jgi:hypothetical protein
MIGRSNIMNVIDLERIGLKQRLGPSFRDGRRPDPESSTNFAFAFGFRVRAGRAPRNDTQNKNLDCSVSMKR